jgi:hypothetical protein
MSKILCSLVARQRPLPPAICPTDLLSEQSSSCMSLQRAAHSKPFRLCNADVPYSRNHQKTGKQSEKHGFC